MMLITNRIKFCVPIPSPLSERKPQRMSAIDEVTKMTKPKPVQRRPRSSETMSAASAPAPAPYHCSASTRPLLTRSPSPQRREAPRSSPPEIPAFAGMTGGASSARSDELAADQHAADLVGAGADVEQLG